MFVSKKAFQTNCFLSLNQIILLNVLYTIGNTNYMYTYSLNCCRHHLRYLQLMDDAAPTATPALSFQVFATASAAAVDAALAFSASAIFAVASALPKAGGMIDRPAAHRPAF